MTGRPFRTIIEPFRIRSVEPMGLAGRAWILLATWPREQR